MTAEEISGGREPRRWLRPLGLALSVLLVAGVGAERLVLAQERSALRRCVVEAESDLDDLTARTAGIETYIAPAVNRPDLAPGVRRSLRGLVQETVVRGLPALERDQARCTSVRAWHGTVRTGRAAYLAHLDQRTGQLRRAVGDIDALHVPVPELVATRDRARAALAEAGVTLSP